MLCFLRSFCSTGTNFEHGDISVTGLLPAADLLVHRRDPIDAPIADLRRAIPGRQLPDGRFWPQGDCFSDSHLHHDGALHHLNRHLRIVAVDRA